MQMLSVVLVPKHPLFLCVRPVFFFFSLSLAVSRSLSLAPPQVVNNSMLRDQFNTQIGVCVHNGIVHRDQDEWTMDGCTKCTCQVRASLQPEINLWGGDNRP